MTRSRRSVLKGIFAAFAVAAAPVRWAWDRIKPVSVTLGGRHMGDFDTIEEAMNAVPMIVTEPLTIDIAPGEHSPVGESDRLERRATQGDDS